MKQAYPAFLLSLTLLAGCGSVGPDYSAPVLPAAQRATSFGAPIAGLGPGEVEVQWWQVFDEPALSQLIQQALAANHDIGIAAARLDEAKALLRESRQGFLPSGGAALGYEHRQRSEVETPFGEQRSIETTRAAVDAAWEIDLFGRVRRSVEAAQAQAGSRQALLRNVQASLVGQMVSVGAATEFDRLRAEALLRNVEAVAPDLERRRAKSTNALAVLLGQAPQGFKPPLARPGRETLNLRTLQVGDPAGLLARRADIAAAERTLAAATAQIGVETAGLYPDIQVQGSIGLLAGSLSALGDAGMQSNFIAPVIRWSLLDTGRVRARIAASEARTQAALIAYDQTVLRALQETDDAFQANLTAGNALGLRLLEAAANREAASFARERFAQGEGVYLDVLEAERADFTSRRALTAARTEQRLAVVGIYKALGGGWEVCERAGQACQGATVLR